MRSAFRLQPFCLAVLTAALCLGRTAGAGVISYAGFTNDVNSGISSANSYTHALDLGSTGSGPTINGVKFTKDNSVSTFNAPGGGESATSNTGSYVALSGGGSGMNSYTGNAPTGLDAVGADGVRAMLTDFWYNATASSPYKGSSRITLSNLTPNVTYDLRLYCRQWTANEVLRKNNLTFNGEGIDEPVVQVWEDDSTHVPPGLSPINRPFYISYGYTAVASGQVTVFIENSSISDANGTWHLYGLTNEVVPQKTSEPGIAEPAPLVLMLAGLRLLRRRRTT